MNSVVVAHAQQGEVVEIGPAADLPLVDVVRLTPSWVAPGPVEAATWPARTVAARGGAVGDGQQAVVSPAARSAGNAPRSAPSAVGSPSAEPPTRGSRSSAAIRSPTSPWCAISAPSATERTGAAAAWSVIEHMPAPDERGLTVHHLREPLSHNRFRRYVHW